jgi:hypothetical protein
MRVARLSGVLPAVLSAPGMFAVDEFLEDEAVYCSGAEASPGPYSGQLDEGLFNDSFSFGWGEDDMFVDLAFGY